MLSNKLKKLWRMFFPGIQTKRVKPWFAIDGDSTLRLDYPELNTNSIVVDLGGYKGQWASDIYGKYGCKVYSFEPVEAFYLFIKKRFENNQSIKVFHCALGNDNKEEAIYVNKDGSSSIEKNGISEKMVFIKFDEMMNELALSNIDLLKINIEGGEYDLLDYLIQTKWIKKIDNIQVQFHDFFPDARNRMTKIQQALALTHYTTYQFEFVWENWKIKSN